MRKAAGFAGKTHDETVENLYRNLGADQCAADFADPVRILETYGLIEEEQDDAA